MKLTEPLIGEIKNSRPPQGHEFCPFFFRAAGYRRGTHTNSYGRRADGIASLFCDPAAHIYKNDLIVGSILPLFKALTDDEKKEAEGVCAQFPERTFITNNDHFSPDYETVLNIGITGLLDKIEVSKKRHADDADSVDFLESMRVTLLALQNRILSHAEKARSLIGTKGYDDKRLERIAENCERVANGAVQSFEQGLQLVWMIHSSFLYEGRYAMALGRMDQYLYPLYLNDVKLGRITKEEAAELFGNVFAKICERRFFSDNDDVVNICIGGVDRDGKCAVNDLSYCVLWAVKELNLPGPNLSARITPDTPDEFLDECLKSIGTGLGYPALMNDAVNMAALGRYGYDEEDIRNYSMVGCIENFITGMQPPWSDGRFDTPRFLEYLLFDGEGYDKQRRGIHTLPLCKITSMDIFMGELEKQIAQGVKEYADNFNKRNIVPDPENYTSPFISCFCRDCIEKGRDINMGGAKYPSVHGAGLMGVGTMSDSLAAIETVVFRDKEATLSEVAQAVKCNFEGFDDLRKKLLCAPKYGNNDDMVDKYAVWFTKFITHEFDKYRTYDGGGIYTAMAANTNNIYAGKIIGATPDGRLAGEPLSDAASPTYGRDRNGVTSTLLSVSKPDYTLCACGTVVNQKFSPSMFDDDNRGKLLQLVKVYFSQGGQEIQINATSTDILRHAMEEPEKYGSLVVRVSGFSAFYVKLQREVQDDILRRTQHERSI